MSRAVIIFAKAPVAGQAKTRLIPALGPEGAAALAERLLVHAVQQALALPELELILCVTPACEHPAFHPALQAGQGRLQLVWQGEGDLGERMQRALSHGLARHQQVVLMGSDAPALETAVLSEALQTLDTHDAVFVPALDGGYALVGLRQAQPALFTAMRWSCAQVMAETASRANGLGLSWKALPAVADIDVPADLQHLPAGWL